MTNKISSTSPLIDQAVPQTAHVVFCGQSDVWWLKWLKPGFRHCFVVLHDGASSVAVDPLSCFTEVVVWPYTSHMALPQWYQSIGLTVVPAPVDRSSRRVQWFGLFTCVEAVKRILGVRKPWILTPWQLYRHLSRLRAPHQS